MKEQKMTIGQAVLSGELCRDCCYYDCCFYDRDCRALEILTEMAIIHENIHRNNSDESGDKA